MSCYILFITIFCTTTAAANLLSTGSNFFHKIKSENPFENIHYWLEKVNTNPKSTWKAGQNFDLGLPSHYVKRLIGTLPSKELTRLPYKAFSETDMKQIQPNLPESFDAREKWSYCKSLQDIRDQGDCGSCWAVAATSVLSDRLCISTEGRFNGYVSAEDLLSCCKTCGAGCEGGYVDEAWVYFKNFGVVTGGDYNSLEGCKPYSKHPCSHYGSGHYPKCSALEPMFTPECKNDCTNPNYNISFRDDKKKVHTAYKVQPDISKIQAELMNHGPLEVVYDVFEDFLMYKSGVYKRTVTDENKFIGLHAVKLIGWGTDGITNLPYWLVQNSWNVDWGERGLFKIIRGINECNFELDLFGGLPLTEKS